MTWCGFANCANSEAEKYAPPHSSGKTGESDPSLNRPRPAVRSERLHEAHSQQWRRKRYSQPRKHRHSVWRVPTAIRIAAFSLPQCSRDEFISAEFNPAQRRNILCIRIFRQEGQASQRLCLLQSYDARPWRQFAGVCCEWRPVLLRSQGGASQDRVPSTSRQLDGWGG